MTFHKVSFFSAVVALVFCAFTNNVRTQSLLSADPFNTHGGTALAPTGSGGTSQWDLATANWSNAGLADVTWMNIAPGRGILGGRAGITITDSTLTLDFDAFTPAATDRFFIALSDGTDAATETVGSIIGLPSGFAVVYDANGDAGFIGNDIAIEPVSEASTWCAAALAAAFIGFQLRHSVRAAVRKFIHRLTIPFAHRSKTFLHAR